MAIKFLNTVQVDTDVLYVDASTNKVGIGTTSPSTVLEVSSSGVNGVDISQSASNASQSGRLFFTTNTASEGFALFNANGTFQINSGGIPNDTSGNNRISIIGSSGNVGIGTTTPGADLEVVGADGVLISSGSGSTAKLTLKGISGSYGGGAAVDVVGGLLDYMSYYLRIKNSPGTLEAFTSYAQVSGRWSWDGNKRGLRSQPYTSYDFRTQGSSQMAIYNNNVGIGTTSPGAKLDVSGGDIRLRSNATYIKSTDINGTETRVLGISSSNTTYIGPIDMYQGGGIIYGNSPNVAYHGFYGGGSEKVRINSNGNVGINTTNPGAKLDVVGTGSFSNSVLFNKAVPTGAITPTRYRSHTGYSLTSDSNYQKMVCYGYNGNSANPIFQVATKGFTSNVTAAWDNDASTRFTVLAGGNVGIGTTSPSELLHLSSTGPARLLIEADTDNITETDNAQIILKQDGGAVVGSLGYKTNTNGLEITNNYQDAGGILTFGTRGTERMRVSDLGNIGVNTTNPYSKLHVASGNPSDVPTAGTATGGLFVSNTNNTYGINMGVSGSGWGFIQSQRADGNATLYGLNLQPLGGNVGMGTTNLTTISAAVTTLSLGSTVASTSGGIAFQVSGGVVKAYNYVASNYLINQTVAGIGQIFYGAGSERMRIHNTTGNVGIGTTSPAHKLDVSGEIHSSTYVSATAGLGVDNTNGQLGRGISLYGGPVLYPQYGLLFAQTADLGTYGGVSGDWATYMTMSGTATRGWIWKAGSVNSTSNNVASISGVGQLTLNSTATATNFIVSSDKTLKNNIKEIDNKHVDVNWRNFELKSEPGIKRAGVIAQELEIKHPEFVRTADDGLKSVAYIDLLITKIAELEARLEKLEITT